MNKKILLAFWMMTMPALAFAQAPAPLWWCAPLRQYYPTVRTCPAPWLKVARPPGLSQPPQAASPAYGTAAPTGVSPSSQIPANNPKAQEIPATIDPYLINCDVIPSWVLNARVSERAVVDVVVNVQDIRLLLNNQGSLFGSNSQNPAVANLLNRAQEAGIAKCRSVLTDFRHAPNPVIVVQVGHGVGGVGGVGSEPAITAWKYVSGPQWTIDANNIAKFIQQGDAQKAASTARQDKLRNAEQQGYQLEKFEDFILDGKKLAASETKIIMRGFYQKIGDNEVLQPTLNAVYIALRSGDHSDGISILTDDASRDFRKGLLQCSNPDFPLLTSCQITVIGHVTMCTMTTLVGSKHLPCLAVEDGW